jgi:hypothetical protein
MPIFNWVVPSGTTSTTTASTNTIVWTSAQTASAYGLGSQTATTSANDTINSWALYEAQRQASTTAYYYCDQQGATYVEHAQYLALAQSRAVHYRERTEEERIREEVQRAAAVAAARRRGEEHQAALARSREFLLAHLTPAQRRTFEENRWFVVQGGNTRQRYRIRTESYTGNIDVLDGERVAYRLCAHCSNVPLYDHHLAQKMSLECDEENFLRVANRH